MTAARSAKNVLVTEANAIGALAAIRSLGQAGYVVHACAPQRDALGFSSRHARTTAAHPPYDSADFLPWLRSHVTTCQISLIIPSEGFLIAVRDVFDEIAPLLPVSNDKDIVYDAMSKYALFRVLSRSPHTDVSNHLTPFLLVDEREGVPSGDALSELGLPIFVKGDACSDKLSSEGSIEKADSIELAADAIRRLLPRYGQLVVQGFVPGVGAGQYFFLREGEVLAEYSNICTHEVPHTGGLCSLRRTWLNAAMREDALAKLRAMRWEGVAMLEYRVNPENGEFWLIEMNARFWAALHLALYAGIDFPTVLADRHYGLEIRPLAEQIIGDVICRCTFPYEVGYLRSLYKDSSVSRWRVAREVFSSILQTFDSRVKSDLAYPGDRRVYLAAVRRFIRSVVHR